MFLLPSLPFGSASGGKTQPLLHPSPADRDERGGLMQSSWAALPAPAGTAHPTTNTAELLRRRPPAPRPVRGLCGTRWDRERGEGRCSSSRASSRAPSSLPASLGALPGAARGRAAPGICSVQRMGIPRDLQHPEDEHPLGFAASSLAHWRRGWGPPALAFAMAKPPQAKAVCLLWSCLCPLYLLEKHWGETWGIIAAHPTLAAAGEGASGLSPPGRSHCWWDPAS